MDVVCVCIIVLNCGNAGFCNHYILQFCTVTVAFVRIFLQFCLLNCSLESWLIYTYDDLILIKSGYWSTSQVSSSGNGRVVSISIRAQVTTEAPVTKVVKESKKQEEGVVVNKFKPKDPYIGRCLLNTKITGDDAPGETWHMVFSTEGGNSNSIFFFSLFSFIFLNQFVVFWYEFKLHCTITINFLRLQFIVILCHYSSLFIIIIYLICNCGFELIKQADCLAQESFLTERDSQLGWFQMVLTRMGSLTNWDCIPLPAVPLVTLETPKLWVLIWG